MKRSLWILGVCIILGAVIFTTIIVKYNVHTDLSGENIDNLYLLSDVTAYIESKKLQPSEDVMHPGYTIYEFENVFAKLLTVKEENGQNKIYRIGTSNLESKTSKNISIGSTVAELINIYGEEYTEHWSDQVDKLIKYKDKENDITLTFYIYQNKVDHINLEITDFYK